MMDALLGPVARTGGRVRRALGSLGSLAWLVGQLLRHTLRLRLDQLGVVWQVTRLQIRFTALDALPLALLTALLLGGITLLQVYGSWSSLGAEAFFSRLLAKLVVRELGPLLVGILVLSRSGTAIAAEMATMKLGGEIDTLVVLGVNPYAFLLAPRILGGMVSLLGLLVCFDAVALLGGFSLAALLQSVSLRGFLDALNASIEMRELWITLAKGLAFGALIPLLSMAAGLRVKRSTTEIPQAVTRAAVSSLVTLLLVGALLSAVFYG